MKKVVGVMSFLLLLCLPAAPQAQQTIRVNAGGSAYRDSKGQTWSADYGFNTGSLSHSAPSAPITGSPDPILFKSARVGVTTAPELQYQFPLANGLYKVNLYFAETYYNKAGSRVFDVQMQGGTVFSGLDIFAQAGIDHPLVKSAQVSVTQGQIVIRFVHRANANVPVISAIEILPSGSAPPPASTAPSVTTQPKSQTVSVGQAATFSVVAGGTAPLTYQWLKNGSSISGASGASYTTPAATSAENGSTYQVEINNSAGRLTSAAATLTVSSHPTVTVNWSDVHQQIDGFGASSVSTGDGITNSQADLFWSTTAGVGLSLLRVQIETNGTYPDLATMQKAQDRGVRIWGTPWSPPGSMKSNGSTNNGGSLLASDYQAYADYLSSYVLGLKNSYGINLYALSIQNEPDYTASWQSCIWTGQQFHDFLRNNLLPTFSKNGVTAKIIMPEESGWKFDLATTTLNDSVTAAGVNIIAGHNYDGASAAPYPLGQKPEQASMGDGSIFVRGVRSEHDERSGMGAKDQRLDDDRECQCVALLVAD